MPEYDLRIQKPHLCGPTCLQMVLERRGMRTDQQQLAKQLGTHVSVEHKDAYTADLIADSEHTGTPLKLFDTLDIQGVRIQTYQDIDEEFLREQLEEGNDIIANIHLRELSGHDWGHYVLIQHIDEQAHIIDPAHARKNSWSVDTQKLIDAMSPRHDGKKRGVVIIVQEE